MTTAASQKRVEAAGHQRIAADLVAEAKRKEHEAACWLGLSGNIDEARHAVHSALDAVLDATQRQIEAVKAQFGSGAA